MSKRREPGEIVRRKAGSGFVGSADPEFVQVPLGKAYEYDCVRGHDGKWKKNDGGEASKCLLGCGDEECREWANLMIVGGLLDGEYICHVSECEMEDRY